MDNERDDADRTPAPLDHGASSDGTPDTDPVRPPLVMQDDPSKWPVGGTVVIRRAYGFLVTTLLADMGDMEHGSWSTQHGPFSHDEMRSSAILLDSGALQSLFTLAASGGSTPDLRPFFKLADEWDEDADRVRADRRATLGQCARDLRAVADALSAAPVEPQPEPFVTDIDRGMERDDAPQFDPLPTDRTDALDATRQRGASEAATTPFPRRTT